MANEFQPEDFSSKEIKALWQDQKVKEAEMSLDEIQNRASKAAKRVFRRTAIGLFVTYSLIAYFLLIFFSLPNLIARIGACLTILALAYMAYQLHSRHGRDFSTQLTGASGIEVYRAELERQRDFHRGSWLWSRLLTLVPSYLLFVVGVAIAQPQMAKLFGAVIVVAIFLAIRAVPLNRKEARLYQSRLDELDLLEK